MLTELWLGGNKIGDVGAKAIAEALKVAKRMCLEESGPPGSSGPTPISIGVDGAKRRSRRR